MLVLTRVLRCHGPPVQWSPGVMVPPVQWSSAVQKVLPPAADDIYPYPGPLSHLHIHYRSINLSGSYTPYSVQAMTTATSRHLWRYTTLPPVVPLALGSGRASSQYNKLLSLPGDISNFSPREFWSPIVMMTTPRGPERVVGITGDLLRDKVSARSLAW